MAKKQWTKQKVNPQDINGGYEYDVGDQLSLEAINAIVNNSLAESSGGSATWGGITGNIDDQEDLKTKFEEKQDTLTSGINIKTINNESILGEGNLDIQGGVTQDDLKEYVKPTNNLPTSTLGPIPGTGEIKTDGSISMNINRTPINGAVVDNDIYLSSAYVYSDAHNPQTRIYKYSTIDKTSSLVYTLGSSRADESGQGYADGCSETYGNKIYTFGGLKYPWRATSSNSTDIVIYDTSSNSVNVIAGISGGNSICCSKVKDKIYVFGGSESPSKIIKFDCLTNTSTELSTTMTIETIRLCATVGTDIYLFNGSDIYLFNSIDETFTKLDVSLSATISGNACCSVVGDYIYIFYSASVINFNTIDYTSEILNINFPSSVDGAVCGTIGLNIYISTTSTVYFLDLENGATNAKLGVLQQDNNNVYPVTRMDLIYTPNGKSTLDTLMPVANPETTEDTPELSSMKINGVDYKIAGGSGGATANYNYYWGDE